MLAKTEHTVCVQFRYVIQDNPMSNFTKRMTFILFWNRVCTVYFKPLSEISTLFTYKLIVCFKDLLTHQHAHLHVIHLVINNCKQNYF